ncbi:MAG: gliding motility-associated C-terminal domain-containing protein [Bacteroidales bacterium]|nr:gliding motility-associated C-terminal domain-containing protein [Bacteroidales bacterium]
MKPLMGRLRVIFMCLYFLPGALFTQELILPDTVRSCKVDSLLLQAGTGFDFYLWSTGAATEGIWVYETGSYSVQAKSGDTIDVTGSVYVAIIQVRIYQSDTTLNCGDTVLFHVDTTGFATFWEPDGVASDTLVTSPRESTTFFATITEPATPVNYCTDSIRVEVEAMITVDTVIQLSMGCPDEKVAQMQVVASGSYEPLEYEWSAGLQDIYDPTRVGGLQNGDYSVSVTDTLGCTRKHDFQVKAHRIPDIELYTDKTDDEGKNVVYLQNPTLTFYFENPLYDSLAVDTFQLINWTWNFGDETSSILTTPTHSYSDVGTFDVAFDFTTFYNCMAADSMIVEVKPVKLKVPNVFTPNGDQVNDAFVIDIDEGESGNGGTGGEGYLKAASGDIPKLEDYYLGNTLVIFNRWGQKMYEVDNYQNDWTGENLADGTYFYILKCTGKYRDDVYKGSVMIIRAN